MTSLATLPLPLPKQQQQQPFQLPLSSCPPPTSHTPYHHAPSCLLHNNKSHMQPSPPSLHNITPKMGRQPPLHTLLSNFHVSCRCSYSLTFFCLFLSHGWPPRNTHLSPYCSSSSAPTSHITHHGRSAQLLGDSSNLVQPTTL